MRLIRKIGIYRFKSIREAQFEQLDHFNSLAGLNNAGKSHFLRALNAFFTGEVEKDSPLDIDRDYYRPEVSYKKKKIIRIALTFDLPEHFKFRSGLRAVEDRLGRQFTLTKEWTRAKSEPSIYLGNDTAPLSHDDELKVESFLNLVTFRYIPNRVVPTEIIFREHQALRDLLVRRLARYRAQASDVFEGIRKTADQLTDALSKELRPLAPDISSIRLQTASSLAELAFRFGYAFKEGNVEMSEHEQGSGFQSLLMFQTLRLIDQDYFQKFGWRQAAIWAIEEPESSLHSALEAHVAHYLATISCRSNNRLQIIATTHSDLFLQYSEGTYIVEKTNSPLPSSPASTSIVKCQKRKALQKAAKQGITRWVNPILHYPLDPIVLVEGKSDKAYLEGAMLALGRTSKFRLVSLADLVEEPEKGGVDSLKGFVKANADAIKMRAPDAPVIVLLDWDATSRIQEFKNVIKDVKSYKVLAWDSSEANPLLHSSFKGIERFLPERIIECAERQEPDLVSRKPNGMICVQKEDLGRLKKVLQQVVLSGLQASDCQFIEPMLTRLEQVLGQQS